MANPLKTLQGLLRGQDVRAGTITEISADGIRVATRTGSAIAARSSSDGTLYRVGDTVALRSGVLLGKVGSGRTVVV